MSRFAPLVVTSVLVAHTSIAVPPAPLTNVQAIILPSEVLLRWDPAPGADYYRVYLGGPDKRWIPLTNHLHTPTFRDTDFTTSPSWYQIGAYNNAGEASYTEPFQVYGDPLNQDASYLPYGLSVRPVSDTSVTIGWTLLDTLGGDAMIEVGPSLTDLTNFACVPEFKRRHDFVITNLQPDSSYIYRITSSRSVGKAFTYWNRFTTRPHTEPPPKLVDVSFWNNPVVVTDTDLPVRFTLTAHSASGMPTTYHLLPSPNLRGQILGQAPDLTFVPSPGTAGRDVLNLIYTDGGTNLYTAINLDVYYADRPPIARDFSLNFWEDYPRKFTLSAFDWEGSSRISYKIIQGPTNGVMPAYPWLYGTGEFQYDPRTNFFGVDHFTYAAFDGVNTGNVATVRINVTPQSDRPVAEPVSLIVTQNSGVTYFSLRGYDPDDLPGRWPSAWFYIASRPQHGVAQTQMTAEPYGRCLYQPSPGYTGNDSFTYAITDGPMSATGTVSIVVVPNNHRPVADSFTVFTEFGVALPIVLSGSDADGDALGFAVLHLPEQRGTVSGTPPRLTYTPAAGFSGTDYVHFLANDGLENSMQAGVITILVAPSNAPPTAPTALAATAISKSQINLSWQDNSGREKQFKIERMGDAQQWKEIGRVAANVTAYADKAGLRPQKSYSYRVRASSKQGNSAYSETASATTPR